MGELLRRQDLAGAEEHFQQALHIDPDYRAST